MGKRFEDKVLIIDLFEIWNAIWRRKLLLICTAWFAAIIAYLYVSFTGVSLYKSTTEIYVLNKQEAQFTNSVTYNELLTASELTLDYVKMVKSPPVMEAVIAELELDNMTWESLASCISVSTPEDGGRIISITASASSPIQSKRIVDSVCRNVATRIMRVMDVQAVNVVSEGKVPTHKYAPSTKKPVFMFSFVAVFVLVCITIISVLLDDKVKSTDDIEEMFGLSVMGTIPYNNKNTPSTKSVKKIISQALKIQRYRK